MKSLEEIILQLYIQYLVHVRWDYDKQSAYKAAISDAKYFRKRMQKTLSRLPKPEPIDESQVMR